MAAIDGMNKGAGTELSDDKNPAYMFQTIHHELLEMIVAGKIDAVELARTEIANRGYLDNLPAADATTQVRRLRAKGIKATTSNQGRDRRGFARFNVTISK